MIGDLGAGLKQLMTMEHRIAELTKEVETLKTRDTDTRERLVRLEVIIEEARKAAAQRRRLTGD